MPEIEVEPLSDGDPEDFRSWAPLVGDWRQTESGAYYLAPKDPAVPAAGTLISPWEVREGLLETVVEFSPDEDELLPQARIVFGFDSRTQANYSAGLGGYNALYVVEALVPGRGFFPIRIEGRPGNLERSRRYRIQAHLSGQEVTLNVDDVEVLTTELTGPLAGSQVGVTAWGRAGVEFSEFTAGRLDPTAFVVMQFGEPYDTLYRDVIQPVCEDMDLEAERADDVYGPGVIISDIIQRIREATVVIAEITPPNPNVFYELGYAQASGKPAILLAQRGERLPFDISGYRCIFYDDTIGGKREVEADLRRHLEAIS